MGMNEENDDYIFALFMLLFTGIYFGLYLTTCMRLFE
jgi:hypothetical protein